MREDSISNNFRRRRRICTMNVSLRELVLTALSSAVVFAALLWAGALAGIQVPML